MTRSHTDRLLVGLLVAVAVTFAGPVVDAGVSASSLRLAASQQRHHRHKNVKHHHRAVVAPVAPTPGAGRSLVGTFKINPGSYGTGKGASGSWFRMVLPGGTAASGPFFSNPDSAASDKTFTLFNPGTDGGLVTGAFQEPPSPAFASNGNALAAKIVTPTKFAGVDFSLSTSAKDAQTGLTVPAPAITDTAGKLTGQLKAFTAEWNKQFFNQGSPKPDGGTPGITSPVTGTYDEATHAFTISWASSIVGGPFNGFTGVWHFEGVFVGCG
jgi:hypothetical protein